MAWCSEFFNRVLLNKSFYVDNLLYGLHSVEKAYKLPSEAVQIMKEDGFNFRKFETNSTELIQKLENNTAMFEENNYSGVDLKDPGLIPGFDSNDDED
ncbi:hypothetical protein NPIL_419161 [Nephila pilipes]|uniref:Uncharacterized protein n=1 Tax=Nephila pilipes TaxID=299642 RepID=A0A8X6NCN6_NEPPI|nr:hypothetical protein NPIL_419161 [Nephila pilipes]